MEVIAIIPILSVESMILKAKGILFIGAGVSGGEEGARHRSIDHARR